MTFSQQILIGLVSGIVTGVFFGERASAIQWVADGFVKLLQMMVLPYITVSIIASLGSLKPAELRTLGVRAAAVIGGLWLVGADVRVPDPADLPVHSKRVVLQLEPGRAPRAEFDFVALYVPSNPFHALANNVVPAVVLFSIVLGIALVGVERSRAAARRAVRRRAQAICAGDALRHPPHALRPVCDCRQRGRHARSAAVGPPADLSRGLRRSSRCW